MVKQIQAGSNLVEVGGVVESSLSEILNRDYKDSKIVVIVDENTEKHCWPFILTSFEQFKEAELVVLPPGEAYKDLEICSQIWGALLDYNIQRKDLIVNLGGGVVTDMGGFIASVYKRGIDFINIPTSLMAMVDASVGGKTGVNFSEFKNQLGVFSSAKITICDKSFLSTLPDNEVLAGKAEMLKHGLIASKELWDKLIEEGDKAYSNELIFEAISIKADIVERDFKEANERKKLNFGHTVAHAIEGFLVNRGTKVSHGECVAWGMLVESYLSREVLGLKDEELENIKNVIQSWYPPLPIDPTHFLSLLDLMRQDKKNTGEMINFTLLKEIGVAEINHELEDMLILTALGEVFKH